MARITEKTASLGKWLIAIGVIIFLGYWALLLEPIQLAYINAKKTPSLIVFGLFGLVVGFLAGAATWVGFWFATWQKREVQNTSVHEFLQSKYFRAWTLVWMGLFLLFTLLWRGGNF